MLGILKLRESGKGVRLDTVMNSSEGVTVCFEGKDFKNCKNRKRKNQMPKVNLIMFTLIQQILNVCIGNYII